MDKRRLYRLPEQGLYDPRFEHDACGVGFVCNVSGERSHAIVQHGLDVLNRLSHRGATGADPETGDGAGITIQIPHDFFASACDACGFTLPEAGEYGTGIFFLPTDVRARTACKEIIASAVHRHHQTLLGWRSVPINNANIGATARQTEPAIEQVFIGRGKKTAVGIDFERQLYLIRKDAENTVRQNAKTRGSFFYITGLSARTIIYKGLLMPTQVAGFFPDLTDKRTVSALCLVHSRYSTNTFPTWDLAQPFRFLAHNGEINTLRGNINWMRAREGLLKCDAFGKDIQKILPVIVPGGSDSASIDNLFELLVLSGRSLPHAMMMLIPAAWEQDTTMDRKLRDFYRYHACISEPWDGPAAIAFTDGTRIGAVLDRNGLRPARYLVTTTGMVVMASEVGVLPVPADQIAHSGRLEPGKMFFIDTSCGRIIDDREIKEEVAHRHPYGTWVRNRMVDLATVPGKKAPVRASTQTATELAAFGYTREDLKVIIKPMAETAAEPIGSMGNDTPHALLSQHPQLVYSYFKQLFAQVTNPAIDPIREEVVMSLESYIGPESNLLDETPEHCHRLNVHHPVLTNHELEQIRSIKKNSFRTKTISLLFPVGTTAHSTAKNFAKAIDRVCAEAAQAINDGYTFVILSDRGVSSKAAPLPALLATGAVHHHLVKCALRTQIGIIVESAEPREVHHFALLFGYGADCVNPYLAYESLDYLIKEGELTISLDTAVHNYIKAVHKGILKILSKMGISTLQGYRGAQIFEALGLHEEVIERCFPGTVSRIGGARLSVLAAECALRHASAYKTASILLPAGGIYQWKRDGESHLWNPQSIAALQDAARTNSYTAYKEFARLINDQRQAPTTLRSLLSFKTATAIPIDQVESAESILRRFATGAMSFGSISRGAHQTLALAMNRLGGRSNTGEGGEDPARFKPLPNGDSIRSAIKQVASGRFGVTTNYLVNADELQIKIAQGAKPGEGGQLPGHKVSVEIARIRYTTPGVTLISPPPHHDIYSIEDLAQLIFDLKNTNPAARISVKLVSEIGVGTIAAGVAKGHADMILISGGDGGTGASPVSSIRHAGLPWELGLSETHQTLVLNDLRSRVRLQTDGQMRTGRDVAIAAMLGAEEYGFCTAALIVCGCVMLRHCHLNNCSVGVATQDEILQKRFAGSADHVANYFRFVIQELREIMASLGIRTMEELIGRTDLLTVNTDILPWKAKDIDFSRILYKPAVPATVATRNTITQNHAIERVLDRRLIELAEPALGAQKPVTTRHDIQNTDRTTGAMLSGAVCKKYGENGFPDDTIHCVFTGVAGQSFGAFLAKGITFELEGMANDYVGKGISGGKIIIYPHRTATYDAAANIIIGNTTFYGAITGEAYIRGVAGERFCIRNSGLLAVVEGVGDHGCEYMTGGRVVILGTTGRNFAAGMSGGIAYIYDIDGTFKKRYNPEMVALEPLLETDITTIHDLIVNHERFTGSPRARQILESFQHELHRFVKVMPLEYKRILAETTPKRTTVSEVSDG